MAAAAAGWVSGPGADPRSGSDSVFSKSITALEDLAIAIPSFTKRLQNRELLDEHQLSLSQSGGCIVRTGGLGEAARFRVKERIGEGTFCVVFRGELFADESRDTGGQDVAVKFELKKTDSTQLRNEYRMYKRLPESDGFPKIYSFGEVNFHKVIVMDLLGPSLESKFQQCGRHFSSKTVCMLAIQMLSRIQWVHDNGLIYRDIKPENFLVGLPGTDLQNRIFLVDFGMAKVYRDPETKEHIPYGEAQSLSGTARYMSINAHCRRSQSRRDDLEALGHVFLYFLRGSLPWQGIKAPQNGSQRYDMMCEKKQATTIADLCQGHPEEFAEYLQYTRELYFDADPDYDYLKGLFQRVLAKQGDTDDGLFDWSLPTSATSQSTVHQAEENIGTPPPEAMATATMQNPAHPPSSPPGKRGRAEFASDLKPPTGVRIKKSSFLLYDSEAQNAMSTLHRDIMAKRYSFHRTVGRNARAGANSAAMVAAAAAVASAAAAVGGSSGGSATTSSEALASIYSRPLMGSRQSGSVISPVFTDVLDKRLASIISELEDMSDKLLQGGDWTGVSRVRTWFGELSAALEQELKRLKSLQENKSVGGHASGSAANADIRGTGLPSFRRSGGGRAVSGGYMSGGLIEADYSAIPSIVAAADAPRLPSELVVDVDDMIKAEKQPFGSDIRATYASGAGEALAVDDPIVPRGIEGNRSGKPNGLEPIQPVMESLSLDAGGASAPILAAATSGSGQRKANSGNGNDDNKGNDNDDNNDDDNDDDVFALVYRTASGTRRVIRLGAESK